MKKFLSGIALTSALLSGTAMAADVKIAPAAFDWSGPYVGLDVGAALNSSRWTDPINGFAPFNTDGSGFAAGGVFGYRKQINNLVLGFEGSADWLGVSGEGNCAGFAPTCVTKMDFLGLLQANVGVAKDRFHFYGTGGVAFGDYQYFQKISANQSWNGGLRTGWTVGAGLDYAVSDRLIAGVRWNYYDFGKQANGGGVGPMVLEFAENGHLVTARLEYKF